MVSRAASEPRGSLPAGRPGPGPLPHAHVERV